MSFNGWTCRWIKTAHPYTGVELRPHFILTEFGIRGSGIAAFEGACDVKTNHLVDWEDRLAQDHIRAAHMIHFLGEFFGISLREGVLLQRWLVAMLADQLAAQLTAVGASALELMRKGDDLFYGKPGQRRKLTVSIVTASPVSVLLHLGINLDSRGAPVPAIGLEELGIGSKWVEAFLETICAELTDMEWACAKVRPVV